MPNPSLRAFGSRVPTPQSQPIPGRSDMVKNSAGGYTYEIDIWSRLHRWLILGSDGGSYYASERSATFSNLESVQRCIDEDGPRVVSIVCDISKSGRAPKNDQALFVLAMCSAAQDDRTRAAALAALPEVARTGTHLFQFITYTEQFRRWGRGLRNAVARWYTEKDPERLALQLVKYRQRENWTHRDALRKSHPTGASPPHRALIDWAVHGLGNETQVFSADNGFRLILGFERVQKAETAKQVAELVTTYNLPWEAVPSQFVNDLEVREALLAGMPIGALVRQLGLLTDIGLLTNTSEATKLVLEKLSDQEAIERSRIHPLNVLLAMGMYVAGGGIRRSWNPVTPIVDKLDDVFYASFGNVEPTGKRRLIGLDVSGSMNHALSAAPGLTVRMASAAMAMVAMKTGDPYEIVGFTAKAGRSGYWNRETAITTLPFSPRQRLDDICRYTDALDFGATDCAQPMLWAKENGKEFDSFEIYTDNETWHGNIHPSQALQQYREWSGIPARLTVVGMTATKFSIADPRDPGMLDVVGFDTAAPNIIAGFVKGEF